MSFWNDSSGNDVRNDATGNYETPSGDLEPIPDGSTVLAFIKEAKWDNTQQDGSGARYIKIRWDVEQPESVARRVVFQKLFVTDPDPNAKDSEAADRKRANAIKMLGNIDANARKKLRELDGPPTNDQLAMALSTAQMLITCKVWEMETREGGKMSGNWICAVAPKGSKDMHVPDVGGNADDGISRDNSDIPF